MSDGKQSLAPEVEELLDVIRQLLGFSRAHSLGAEPGESVAYSRAKRLLDRYRPATEQTS
jgi:hypothetical protein